MRRCCWRSAPTRRPNSCARPTSCGTRGRRIIRPVSRHRCGLQTATTTASCSITPIPRARSRRRRWRCFRAEGVVPPRLRLFRSAATVKCDACRVPPSIDTMPIAPIVEIVAEIKAGRMVILVDEEDRENEGDLVLAADFVTPEAINFMAKYARGLICLTLTEERCTQLDLGMMTSRNGTAYGTNFTVSIEAAEGVTTGISAADRARTIQAAVAKNAKASDIVQPGHIFPVKAKKGGVLMRAGHTEAGCDLTHMAGLTPASVICEILKE